MNNVNTIVISRRDFKRDEELYEKVYQQIRILLESGYVLVAEDADERGGTIVIQYAPSTNEAETPKPFWLLPNEMVAAADVHIDNEVQRAKDIIDSAKRADNFIDKFGFNGGNKNGGNYDA